MCASAESESADAHLYIYVRKCTCCHEYTLGIE